MSFKNKKVLITAGPTWVPVDKVRVISNTATGRTGILLAERFRRLGAEVTLLLGPVAYSYSNDRIRLLRFVFFDDLRKIIKEELRSREYDIFIHSAAVADYRPKRSYPGKVKSDLKRWRLDLSPTPKIIDSLKKAAPSLFLVGFKFQPGATKRVLITKARSLAERAGLDLVVANSISANRYTGYILACGEIHGPFKKKSVLVSQLISAIAREFIRD